MTTSFLIYCLLLLLLLLRLLLLAQHVPEAVARLHDRLESILWLLLLLLLLTLLTVLTTRSEERR